MRDREISAVELTEYFIERIASCTDKAIFISTTFERARCEARESDRRYARGTPASALDGVPVAWKDVFDVAGTLTTAGSPVFLKQPPADQDATLVHRLSRAGLLTLGKTNLTQFANSALGLNPYYGTPGNAAATGQGRVPGGSSSGAAVAVARGLTPLAIGTDTGGSIRTPAAFNGVVGFKPSVGRYPLAGVFPLARSLDTVGLIARSVEDCIALDLAMVGAPHTSDASLPAKLIDPAQCPVYIPANLLAWADDDVLACFHALMAQLTETGYPVIEASFPELETLHRTMKAHGGISLAEAYYEHRDWVEGDDAQNIDPFVRGRILRGKDMSAYDLIAVQRAREACAQAVWSRLGAGVLAMPTVPHVAPTLAEVSDETTFARINERTTCFSVVINMLDGCSVSLPAGASKEGLPVGISFSLAAGNETRLLQLGQQIERMCSVAGAGHA